MRETPRSMIPPLALIALFGLLASGRGNRGEASDGDAGSGRRCTTSTECDDAIACTVDTCAAGNVCSHTPIDARCTGAGEHCVAGVGCSTSRPCDEDADCDDAIACTLDACAAGNVCSYTAIDELCTEPSAPSCTIGVGCTAGETRCTSSDACDDHVACTVDTCSTAGRCEHSPLDSLCDEAAGERCTATGCYASMACHTDDDCQDGDFCNGRERCIPELGCAPATMAVRCDDSDPCTIDTCAPATGCVYTCDAATPTCGCMGTIDCTGSFTLSTSLENACIPDSEGNNQVDYDFSAIDVAIVAGQTIVTPRSPGHAHFGTLSDATASCPSVTATATVPGGTTERYTLDVTFTDSDHFSGSFTANLGGLGSIFGCLEGRVDVTGTRIP